MKSCVILGCHAIYGTIDGNTRWHGGFGYLGEPRLLTSQLLEALRLAVEEELMFIPSGGRTRPLLAEVLPLSEAEGAIRFARELLGAEFDERLKFCPEPWARDSFENLFYGMCVHRFINGNWPQEVHVVSFEFKRMRFAIAANALGVSMKFHGIGQLDELVNRNAIVGEAGFLKAACIDPLLRGHEFEQKRRSRTPAELNPDEYSAVVRDAFRSDEAIVSALDLLNNAPNGTAAIQWPWS